QEWFLDQALEERQHWNQAMMLEVNEPLAAGVMKAAVTKVVEQHDAFWLRFRQVEQGWESWSEGGHERENAGALDEQVDLSAVAKEAQGAAIEKDAAQRQASLNLEHGPIARFVEYELGEGRENRLFIVVHHLAMDGVSWRILLEDLERAVLHVGRGEAVQL